MKYEEPSLKNLPDVIILANGDFPTSGLSQALLYSWINGRGKLICCDGAVNKLLRYTSKMPDNIVGDLDSVDSDIKEKLSDRIIYRPCQDYNDLTKAVRYVTEEMGYRDIALLGISGEREDHFISNMSLLVCYNDNVNELIALTETGYLRVIRDGDIINAQKGQQVSIFNFHYSPVSANNLKWPLDNLMLDMLCKGSLNEALGGDIQFYCENPLLVYVKYLE